VVTPLEVSPLVLGVPAGLQLAVLDGGVRMPVVQVVQPTPAPPPVVVAPTPAPPPYVPPVYAPKQDRN
jgi:hypothetical protein